MNQFSVVHYVEHILLLQLQKILELKKTAFLLLKHAFIYTFKSVWLNVHLLKPTSKADKVLKELLHSNLVF